MSLVLRSLSKRYADTVAVQGVDLDIERGRTLALLGPSGCGKSTLLRLIAGLERPDTGSITLAGSDITDQPAQRRAFGVVFQDYALFPHLDVSRNVGFGLVEQRRGRTATAARVAALLDLVDLTGLGSRRVHQLSGGQQQRVALARALAPEPPVLLLDEPLSNLDESLRVSLAREIHDVLDRVESYAVYVTHDQVEAFSIAEQVAVMRSGTVVQVGTPDELLNRPRDAWLARFLGHENVWEGERALRVADWAGVQLVEGDALLLRTDLVRLVDPEPLGRSATAAVTHIEHRGLRLHLELAVAHWATSLHWSGYGREFVTSPRVGDQFALEVPPGAWHRLASTQDGFAVPAFLGEDVETAGA